MYEQYNMIDPAPDEIAAETQQAAEQNPPEADQAEPHQPATGTKYYEINEATARVANDLNSMREYKPGSATAEYRAAVDAAAELVERKKKSVSPFYHDKLDALLDRYARRLAAYYNDYYRNEASCPSILVSGGSNFPVRKKEKQNARRETLWNEYNDIQKILDQIKSIGTGAVDLADPHAREMLQDQLQKLQAKLDNGKAMNAYYRKHKTMKGFPELDDVIAAKMDESISSSYSWAQKPMPDYELTSLRGKIKRVEARLAELDQRQTQQAEPAENTKFDGGEIVRNLEADRLQIIFDKKPDEELRDKLKSNGFRWSPRYSAWQRQLTRNAEIAARSVLGLN